MKIDAQKKRDCLIEEAIKLGVPDLLSLDEIDLLEKYRNSSPAQKAQMQLDARRYAMENKPTGDHHE